MKDIDMASGKKVLQAMIPQLFTGVEIRGGTVSFLLSAWDVNSTILLRLCLKRKIFTRDEITTLLSERIREIGRASYNQHISKGVKPDHTLSAESLAYAIYRCEFKKAELDRIEFDHGDTVETFMAPKAYTLPESVLKQLLELRPTAAHRNETLAHCC